MRISVVIVHYHTPELAAAAVAAVNADLAGSGLTGELLVVDNGSTPAARAALAALPVELLEPGENLGYAGGVNLGMARAQGDFVVVMNPDVLVLANCVATLASAWRAGAAVAGPRFFWDRERRFLLPPAEPRTRLDELAALLAARSEGAAKLARRRLRRRARRHWQAPAPLPSEALSGSLLAIDRRAWEQIGPFDPEYRLFFEETDWLRRAGRAGLRTVYVPQAEAVHLFGRSAAREPRAADWFRESERRFRDRHYGRWFPGLLEGLAARLPPQASASARPPADSLDLSALQGPLSVEVSPNRTGIPAATAWLAAPPAGGWALPAEPDGAGRDEWYCRVVDAGDREVALARLRRPRPGD